MNTNTNPTTWPAPAWPPVPPAPTKRRRSRLTVALAVLLGATLAGTATYAALTWYRSRGSGVTNTAVYELTLTNVTTTDATTAGADLLLDGSTLNPGVGKTTVALVDGPTGAFTVSPTDGYPGYVAPVALTYTSRPFGIAMKLQSATVYQAGTSTPFAAGTAPVVAWLASGGCGATVGGGTNTATVNLRVMTTTAAPLNTADSAAFDVVLQWVPADLYSAAGC